RGEVAMLALPRSAGESRDRDAAAGAERRLVPVGAHALGQRRVDEALVEVLRQSVEDAEVEVPLRRAEAHQEVGAVQGLVPQLRAEDLLEPRVVGTQLVARGQQ